MAKNYDTLLVERSSDGVATITFNRPAKRNAMNPQLHLDMTHCLDELAYDPDVRVIVITGAGESFCAGMDLQEFFVALDDHPTERERISKAAEWRSHRLRLFPKPTIAAVNGWCFGGAFTIVACCDVVIAAEEAQFGLSEINFGKIAGGYVSKALTEVMHPRDALYYLLTGETFDGRKAAEIRFATMAVPLSELMTTVNQVAGKLASKNPLVARASKEAFRHVADMSWEQAGVWLAARSQALDYQSGDTWKTGVDQFASGKYRPGLGEYEWEQAPATATPGGGSANS